jgi:arginine-tRNA-protein transferase
MESVTSPCPYLEGRTSRLEVLSETISEGRYGDLLEDGWRRSGNLCYRSACEGCALCIPIRRPTAASASIGTERRSGRLRRLNADLEIALQATCLDEERFSLYRKYMTSRHGQIEDLAESYLSLIVSPLSRFVDYRLASGKLVALGFVDIADRALSSAYFAFDPEVSRRSLGSYSVYVETAIAKSLGKDYYYLGYWVPGSPKMKYKADFPPFELLLPCDKESSGSAIYRAPGKPRRWQGFGSPREATSALDHGAYR